MSNYKRNQYPKLMLKSTDLYQIEVTHDILKKIKEAKPNGYGIRFDDDFIVLFMYTYDSKHELVENEHTYLSYLKDTEDYESLILKYTPKDK